jgi:C4-dicarboxylate transporter
MHRDGAAGNNDGGNKEPPSGALGAASSADDGKKKAEGGLKKLWQAYNNNLESNPILTKAITSMLGFALGDYLAQKFIDKRVSSSATYSSADVIVLIVSALVAASCLICIGFARSHATQIAVVPQLTIYSLMFVLCCAVCVIVTGEP